jgi:hypothetical protein
LSWCAFPRRRKKREKRAEDEGETDGFDKRHRRLALLAAIADKPRIGEQRGGVVGVG